MQLIGAEDGTIFISSGNPLMPASQYLSMWRSVCASGGSIEVEPISSTVEVWGDLAVSIGSIRYSFKGKGDVQPRTGITRFTNLFKRTPTGWKLYDVHGSEQLR